MATFSYDALKKKYGNFMDPKVVIEIGGVDISVNKQHFSLTDIDVEMTCGFEASIATFWIHNCYDMDNSEFQTAKIKKYILLGSSVAIYIGYDSSVREIFKGFIAKVNFSYQRESIPGVEVTAMDLKGIMMANNYSKQIAATRYSDAVKKILEEEYAKLQSLGIVTAIHVTDTPDSTAPDLAGDLLGGAVSAVPGLGGVAGGLTSSLGNVASGALGSVTSAASGALGSVASGALGSVTSAASGALGSVASGALGSVTSAASGLASGALGSVAGAVGGLAGGALGSVAGGALGGVAGGALGGIAGAATGLVGGALGSVAGMAGGAIGSVAGAAGAVGNVAGAAQDIAGAASGLAGAASGLAGAAGNLTGAASGALSNLAGGAGGALGGVAGAAGGIVGMSSDKTIEMVYESDYEFIVKAAKKFNYEFFAIGGDVYFRKAKEDTEILMELSPASGMHDMSVEYDVTGLVKQVEVRSVDAGKGSLLSAKQKSQNKISLGSRAKQIIKGSTKVYLDPTVSSTEDAGYRADYLLEDMTYRFGTLEAELIGLPELTPGKFVKLTSLGDAVSNIFYLVSVRHILSDNGYVTKIIGKAAKLDDGTGAIGGAAGDALSGVAGSLGSVGGIINGLI